MIKHKFGMKKKTKVIVLSLAAATLGTLPFFAFSSHHMSLYVDKNAGNVQDGSKSHPFKTIGSAIDKADSGAEIHVAKGEYRENLELKKDIKLFGEDRDNTTIKAKKGKWATITMKDDSEINNFTIKDGERGIWVESHAKVSISDCVIKNNDQDGIAIEGSDISNSKAVNISNSTVEKNGMSGIFSLGARRIVVTGSEIRNNKLNGINLAKGTSAWLGDNTVENNSGDGIKLVADGSSVWTKNNSARDNGSDGFEISSFGGVGRINIEKSKIANNSGFGIAKIAKAGNAFSAGYWGKTLTFDGLPNSIFGNSLGSISGIISGR
jgi:parallel beta-helix repeat protein